MTVSHSVVTPFGVQSVAQFEDAEANRRQPRLPGTVSSPSDKLPASRTAPQRSAATPVNAAAVPVAVVGKTKASSKRPSAKPQVGAEDSGRLCPPPAKRCKMLDAGGDQPTELMCSLDAQVVNLARRPDRMDGCSERLRLNCPWLKHKSFKATDGRLDAISTDDVVKEWNTESNVVYQKKRAIRKGWDDLDSYQVKQLSLSPGERGCALSHIRAWQLCLEQAGETNQPLLVLEDDAAPTPEFTSVLRRALSALPEDAHLLYLGYSQAADWRREVSENLVESEYVWTTVGYIVWPEGARILLSNRPVSGPVDNWMAGFGAAGDIKAYCCRPKIVLQADAWNVNSDVGHSDEQYWGPCSDIHHSDAFYWGADCPQPSKSTIWGDIDDDSDDSADSA